MRRDRDGSELELHDDLPPACERHTCDDGWLGDDEMGRPRPCRTCRPWIDDSRQALRQRLYGPGARGSQGGAR